MSLSIARYGVFPFANNYTNEFLEINFSKQSELCFYERLNKIKGENFSTYISKVPENIIIQPSEPLNSVVNSNLLFLELNPPLTLFPKYTQDVVLDFPISLSIFVSIDGSYHLLDFINFAKTKLALYGDPHKGLIGRYWKSNYLIDNQTTEFFKTGKLNISISNTSDSLVKVQKILLDFANILIFYKEQEVVASAKMSISSSIFAETEFVRPRLPNDFTQTIDLIPSKKLFGNKFTMEFGI